MSVITISREFGSEGNTIAAKVAQTLGYHLVDHAFISAILNQYGLVQFDKEYDTLPGFWERFDADRDKRRDVMADMLNRVEHAVAHHGNVVILGRSGFAILRTFADVLRVRLQAPLSVRAARIMTQQKMTLAEAESSLKNGDRVHGAFEEEYYQVPWESTHVFDLVINTGKISPDLAATWLIDAAKVFTTNLEINKPTTASIEVDPILARAVSEALQCTVVHR
jgi:cytidylate kinase